MSKFKKMLQESLKPVIKEMCGKPHKRAEMYEEEGAMLSYDDYQDSYQPEEPENPDYLRGYEDGFEAGKIGGMYGEAKTVFPGSEVELQEGHPWDGSPGEWTGNRGEWDGAGALEGKKKKK